MAAACDDNTYKHLQEQKKQAFRASSAAPSNTHSDNDDEQDGNDNASDTHSTAGVSEAEADAGGDKKIRLGLRSAPFPQAKFLRVRLGMTCAAIVGHYLKMVGQKNAKARLSFDGEDLDGDSVLGDALDDDDEEVMMDVVGM